jgi:hypothetical protein
MALEQRLHSRPFSVPGFAEKEKGPGYSVKGLFFMKWICHGFRAARGLVDGQFRLGKAA